jgi:hypothetical protein
MVLSSVGIGMVTITTRQAKEFGLRTAITFIHIATAGTLLTGVARVYPNDRYSANARFVFDERSQLPESPIAVSRSLIRAPSPGPRAYAGQIFQGNGSVRALRGLNETLANLMIDVFLKAPLAAGQPAQVAPG